MDSGLVLKMWTRYESVEGKMVWRWLDGGGDMGHESITMGERGPKPSHAQVLVMTLYFKTSPH